MWSYEVDLYRLDGRPEKALEVIEAAFPEIKDLPVAWYMRGVVSLDLGRFDEAARDLEQAVAREPFNVLGQFKLSEAYRLLGREELARQHRDIGKAISQKRLRINDLLKEPPENRDDPAYCEQLATLYREIGEAETAERWGQRAAKARRER
jgi:tetratricopeptide (TPR) repeat protein